MAGSDLALESGVKSSDAVTDVQLSLILLFVILAVFLFFYVYRNKNIPNEDNREKFVFSVAETFVGVKAAYLGYVTSTVGELRVYAALAGILFTIRGLNKAQKVVRES